MQPTYIVSTIVRGTEDLKINNTRPLLSGNLQVRERRPTYSTFLKGKNFRKFL